MTFLVKDVMSPNLITWEWLPEFKKKRLKQHCYESAFKQTLKKDHEIEATKDLL